MEQVHSEICELGQLYFNTGVVNVSSKSLSRYVALSEPFLP